MGKQKIQQQDDPALAAILLADLRDMRPQLRARAFQVTAYTEASLRVIDLFKSQLLRFSTKYDRAYQDYESILKSARQTAVGRQEWMDIFIGIGIGVTVGFVSGLVVASVTASATLSASAKLVNSLADEMAEAVVNTGYQKITPQRDYIRDLKPDGIHPAIISSQIWRKLSLYYRNTIEVFHSQSYLAFAMADCEYIISQLEKIHNGQTADMTQSDLVNFAIDILELAGMLLQVNVDEQLPKIRMLDTQLRGAPEYTQRNIEQDIWIVWLSAIPEANSGIIDEDDIENRLNKIGVLDRLGIDFGWWTSSADERAAIRAALREARMIRSKYESL